MDVNTARALVSSRCSADTYPTLSSTEIADLVTTEQTAFPWKPANLYTFGDVVAPAIRNGHVYRCIVGGTSAATEPTWPLYTSPDDTVGETRPHWWGYTGPWSMSEVTDGTAVWREHGPDSGEPISKTDLRDACYRGWLLKAAKASADYDVKLNRTDYNRSQVIDHCMTMAEKYVPMRLA